MSSADADHPKLDTTITCLHEPGVEECLVGVVGGSDPHCVKCRLCGQMVQFKYYSEPDKLRYKLRLYRDLRPEWAANEKGEE